MNVIDPKSPRGQEIITASAHEVPTTQGDPPPGDAERLEREETITWLRSIELGTPLTHDQAQAAHRAAELLGDMPDEPSCDDPAALDLEPIVNRVNGRRGAGWDVDAAEDIRALLAEVQRLRTLQGPIVALVDRRGRVTPVNS